MVSTPLLVPSALSARRPLLFFFCGVWLFSPAPEQHPPLCFPCFPCFPCFQTASAAAAYRLAVRLPQAAGFGFALAYCSPFVG